jgi:hypothetical protein
MSPGPCHSRSQMRFGVAPRNFLHMESHTYGEATGGALESSERLMNGSPDAAPRTDRNRSVFEETSRNAVVARPVPTMVGAWRPTTTMTCRRSRVSPPETGIVSRGNRDSLRTVAPCQRPSVLAGRDWRPFRPLALDSRSVRVASKSHLQGRGCYDFRRETSVDDLSRTLAEDRDLHPPFQRKRNTYSCIERVTVRYDLTVN